MSRAYREKSRKQPPPIPVSERSRAGRQIVPMIPVDESSLGPAMLALNPGMRAFVVAKVMLGLSNAKAAAAAGYSSVSPHAADVHGSRLAHDERIQAAILEEGQKLLRSEGPKSVHLLVKVRDDATATNKDRIVAAKELLDRSGFIATTEHRVTVEHLTEAQKDQRILQMVAELGLPPSEAAKFLIGPPDQKVIDAVFEEVREPAPLTPTGRAAAEKRERENDLRRQRYNMTPEQLAEHKAQQREARRTAAKVKFAEAQPEQTTIEGFIEEQDHWDPNDLSDIL